MKINQPQTTETIYFIKEYCDLEIPIHVAFDDLEAAKAYVGRFLTIGDARIVECQVNPAFYTDITRDCFFVQLNMHNNEATAYQVNDWHRSELAIKGHYFFEERQICVYVMARSENEAIKAVCKIRDDVKQKQE